MVARKPKVLVLLAAGINCDVETEYAFTLAGARPERVHINDFLSMKKRLDDYQILAVPGGFAFGDDIAAGKVLANKIRLKLFDQISEFVLAQKPVIGICNGFQVLVKLGILPNFKQNWQQDATLTFNTSGKFECRWLYLQPNVDAHCIWTRGIRRTLYLPINHGEGRFIAKNKAVLKKLQSENMIVFRYTGQSKGDRSAIINPNGSQDRIAGITEPTGCVIGMMPHPERFVYKMQHPRWTRLKLPEEGQGLQIFRNAVEYV